MIAIPSSMRSYKQTTNLRSLFLFQALQEFPSCLAGCALNFKLLQVFIDPLVLGQNMPIR